MKKQIKEIGISVCIIFFLTAFSFAQQQEKTLELSLEDCILKALKNNLGLAIDVLNPELADISVSLAKEKFLPQLSLSYNASNTNNASYSWLDADEKVTNKNSSYRLQFSQVIPTGGTVSGYINNFTNNTNQRLQTINPRYESTLRLNFTQPLLRNFGSKIARREIIIAQNNADISENNLKTALHNTIYNVEDAYWNLIYTIELLKVRKKSLDLARDLLEKNKRAVEIGTLAPIDILSAASTVATREADILQQEALVRNAEDLLKSIINLPIDERGESVRIVPTDTPTYEMKEIALDEALLIASNNRPDVQATRIDLKNREINVSYAKNQLLPDLSLQASYWSPGISGTQILYLNNDPRTEVVVGSLPGKVSDALKQAFNFEYKNWSLNFTLNIPVDAIFSKAAYAQAKVNFEQAMLRLKNQEQQLFLEIKTAVRAVQTNYKRVQAYKAARELQEKNLEAEEEKFKVGLSTPYLVLQYQRDLTDSQVSELKATIDYNLSLARLGRAMGTTLEEKNIRVSDYFGK